MRKIKKAWRSATYKDDWSLPGPSPKKYFENLLLRYGIKGYHKGMKIDRDYSSGMDLFFPTRRIAVFISDSPLEVEQKLCIQNALFPIRLPTIPDTSWLKAIALIIPIHIEDLRPLRPHILSRMATKLEADLKYELAEPKFRISLRKLARNAQD